MDDRMEIYFSYADEDEHSRKQLEKHLALLRSQGLIAGWHRSNISAGMELSNEINAHLNSAQVILLLVSPDFRASEYCHEVEVKRAMERHRAGEARVIPILLRPVYWKRASLATLNPCPQIVSR